MDDKDATFYRYRAGLCSSDSLWTIKTSLLSGQSVYLSLSSIPLWTIRINMWTVYKESIRVQIHSWTIRTTSTSISNGTIIQFRFLYGRWTAITFPVIASFIKGSDSLWTIRTRWKMFVKCPYGSIPLWTIRTIYPIMPAVTTAGSDSSMDDKDGSQVYLRQYGFGIQILYGR